MSTSQFRVAALLTLALLCGATLAGGAERPNVIVIMTDDQGYGDLSCHGNPLVETPNLDRLASESIRLTDFHVAPMCTPTRSQLLTGVDALRNKAMNVSSGRSLLRRDLATMADVFVANGYRTGLFGKWHLGDNFPYRPHDRGFQRAVWFPSSHIGSVPDHWDNDYFNDVYLDGAQPCQSKGYCTDFFFSEAIAWMVDCRERCEPFFLYLPLNAPHAPYFVADRYREAIAKRLERVASQLPALTSEQRQSIVSFLAMIANIDENMGRLEKFLADAGVRDDTIVVFLTDNGSTLGPKYFNAGMQGGKNTLWEGGHRVPCFIRWPAGGLRPAGTVGELTQVQDLLPTLVELCCLKTPRPLNVDGASLAPVLRGDEEKLPERTLVVHYSRMPGGALRPSPKNASIPRREGAAVMRGKWRLINDKRLYNIAKDPAQRDDVAGDHPEMVAQLRVDYANWWDGVKDQVNFPERIIIGADGENPTLLTCCEWFDVIVDQQRQVRAGDPRNGVWHVEVAIAGDYRFELRRWPQAADLPLQAAAPAAEATDGLLPAGQGLPIAAARLRIGDQTHEVKISTDDLAAIFGISLPAGPCEIETAFVDKTGRELCGAYYLNVSRK